MSERIRPIEQMLELNEDDQVSTEHLDSQVQKAHEQLLQLKRQQEQIEKQKRELEELSRRQEELERGRGEMTDKLTRSLVVLEREADPKQTANIPANIISHGLSFGGESSTGVASIIPTPSAL